MITIHKSTDTGLEVVDRPTKGCWINMIDPSVEETRQIAQDLDLDPATIRSPLNREVIPRAEKIDSALHVLVRIPHAQSAGASIPYVTLPLRIIVTDRSVITICKQEHDLLGDLDDSHREDLSTAKAHRFVLHMLWSIANSFTRYLNDLNQAVDRLEDRLQRSLQNREVLALLRYQKSLVHFTTALKTNGLMLERLQRADLLELKPADADLLDDVITENHEAMEMAGVASDILAQMMDAFASIISNNLNVVMKFLAAITVILIIPQIVATFYGMNLNLPLDEEPLAFLVLVGLSILSSAIVGYFFWKKDWL
jgi:magnesium transporter